MFLVDYWHGFQENNPWSHLGVKDRNISTDRDPQAF